LLIGASAADGSKPRRVIRCRTAGPPFLEFPD